MKSCVIIAFYKFVSLPDYALMKEPLLSVMKANLIRGTIILAGEGINGSVCGDETSVLHLSNWLKNQPGLHDLVFRPTFDDRIPFEKAKVKLRKEIVTMGDAAVSPVAITGTHVSPDEWNQLITDPDVVVIDTRNDYEVKLGTFAGAINPQTDNFRDFPEYIQQHLLDKKDKKIAMFCTGGIRCEKSTSWLRQLGFTAVYQLHGGILNYLESVPQDKSLWQGHCFVFDERVALDSNLQSLPPGSIDSEWKNNNKTSQSSS